MRQGTGGRAAAAWRAAVIGMLAVGASTLPITGVAAGSTGDCTMQPVVRDHTITQGLGSYAELTPGKDTLVRLYLSMPACAPAAAEMQLTSATIAVRSGGAAPVTVSSTPALPTPPPTGTDTNTYPPIASFAAAPMKNATGDPLFVLKATDIGHLLPSVGAGKLDITATLGYRFRTASNAPWTAGTPTTSGPHTASFGGRTNPLRVLVVPMGDRSATTPQFPGTAVSAVESGMLALSRMLPVAEGAGALKSGSGGVRYQVLPADTSMVDLGPKGLGIMGPNKPFCALSDHYDAIERELARYLLAWNSHPTNLDFPADRVVGAVWEGISIGPDTNSSCADGWAKVPGVSSWIRVREKVPASGKTAEIPSNAGALLAMELLHTWGAVSPDAPHHKPNFHSVNPEADATAPDRAYHVANRSFIADDRSAMLYQPGLKSWNEHLTLLEPPDWAHTRCALAQSPATSGVLPCSTPGGVGSAGATVQEYFSLAGVTDGTAAGTDVHTYLSEQRVDTPEGDRDFLLVQRDASGVRIDDFGVPASEDHSAHTGTSTHGGSAFDIAAVVPVVEGAARFELWKGEPGAPGSALLYARDDDAPPTVAAATTAPAPGGVRDVAAAPDLDEVRPAVTEDGLWTAWVEPNGIRVARTDRSNAVSAPLPGADPAWADGGKALVFTRDGNVLRVAVGTSGAAATFADEYVVYDKDLHLAADTSASRPSVGPDGQQVAVSIAGDLYVLDSSFRPSRVTPLLCPVGATAPAGPCRRVSAAAAAETAPSWSAAGIFHERGAEIWVIGANGAGAQKVTTGSMPAARGSQLVFARDGQLWSRSSSDGSEHPLTSGGADAWPAIARSLDVVAFDRSRSGQRDVVMLDASEQVYVVTATDDHPENLRLDVFLGTEDVVPVEVGLRPVSITGSVATFEFRVQNEAGAGGSVSGRLTDGWNVAWFDEAGPVPTAPAATDLSIHTPIPGAEVLQFSALALKGDARIDGVPVPDSALHWAVIGPTGQVVRQGAGRTVDVDPPTAGWTPGAHQVRLTSTADGQTATQVLDVTILKDGDRDGIPAPRDRRCTDGADADGDPGNFDDDSDGDGTPDADDPEPCRSALNGTADFEPDVYYVPAQGLPFSVIVRSSSVDLRKVTLETVAICEVGRYPVHIPAVSWSQDKKGGGYTARFDRSALDAVLRAHPELIGGYVPVVVTGGPAGAAFRVRDASAPNVQPA